MGFRLCVNLGGVDSIRPCKHCVAFRKTIVSNPDCLSCQKSQVFLAINPKV